MARRTKIKNPREARSQRLRRSQNAALNASAWSRLRRREIIASEEPDKIENSETMQIPYDPNNESQRQHEDSESEDEEEDTTSRWKFKLASIRRREIRKELEKILLLDNPFKAGRKYTVSYFRKQWNHQRTFRADHTDEEQERREKLVKIYEHRANLELLRERLTDPDLDLLSDAEVKKISDKIEKVSKKLNKDAAEAEALGIDLPSGEENSITLLGNQPENVDVDRFDSLVLHGLDRRDRLRVICKELRCRQTLHAALVEEWHSHVPWLANHCQPSEYRTSMLRNWDNMRTKMGLPEYASSSNLPEVDVELEEAILEVGADDGEDAEEDMFLNTDAEDDGTDDD
ncbi:hypothetical protein PtA15_16A238 [Puccinia triticina]|uniref:Uncharacterized protein n=1 Tax=Puccinia triticina TaxID=208348 RepID=A0ABY7D6N3_9BASI|nr:uncharacterized protein PtA15_16A238 [Puccinia triticina]WAQ92332.1 hypothetical protein PtA15_16A238 [Puccinia triticina]WAR64062.1 hypothetical protein PtB15_16B221 [Puccinia triticina]